MICRNSHYSTLFYLTSHLNNLPNRQKTKELSEGEIMTLKHKNQNQNQQNF